MTNQSDADMELLERYVQHRAEDAFAELVRRHLGLVHSAAFRQVGSAPLAQEVAQAVFVKLAARARELPSETILPAWLYRVTRREAIDVVRREARRQAREQIATEMNATNASEPSEADWARIEPLIDEAMETLGDTDRTAVLLRYFENKSLREVGATLGTTDEAARKRVHRAVESLRAFFARRGVTVGASGLALVLSAHAVQAVPAGLTSTILTSTLSAAAVAGTTTTGTAVTAAQLLFMTTLQKVLVASVLTVAVVFGTYKVRQAHGSAQAAGEPRAASAAATDAGASSPGDMITTASGLKYQVLKRGAGTVSPQPTDRVRVHYHGTLPDGTVFDSSEERGQPMTFPVDSVIAGWTEGVQLMKVGDRFKFEIPPDLGYGAARSEASRIPPNSTLVFEVELLGIE